MIRAASFLAALLVAALPAWAFDTPAKSAIVFDVNTDQTLMEKNADMALPPASMSKLMTLNMVFEALEDGRLSLDEPVPVSTHAASYGGSTMFLETKDRPTVEQLIRGVIVLSGNDASTALGERLSPDGSEAGFARLMTQRAIELGMTNSTFANANGWPAAGHRMSMRDLAILGKRLVTKFPKYYGYFAEREFQYDDSPVANRFNRNPLLKLNIGADGLKTGHTQEAGYGLVGSAIQNGRRIIFVFSGLNSEEQRAQEAERITNWAFNQFVEKQLFEKGVPLTKAEVWMGDAASVNMATTQDVKALIPVLGRDGVSAKINYVGPLDAPIEKGQEIATLIVTVPGFADVEHPLVATETVPAGGFVVKVRTAATVLFRQLTGRLQSQAGTLF
ncbi:D-alanyl-D-alanine carboxypeptidase family protein [uncultured Litoreibacter sp.]|uniref:D-alanyl-D-alanine carboxypeptidase family protein n=1 Tax=uncultured Litoreibacter sp. TaxID=1392394 RepID=UPI00260E5CDD|nr:D-alanyl-D-alanine carboxypeptidase family protein [uncultured Litoreibacter sp.]